MLRLNPRRRAALADHLSPRRRPSNTRRRHRLLPLIDALEPRRLLTTLRVTTTTDDPTLAGSLPYEIIQSNNTPGSNYIEFDINASNATDLNVPVAGFDPGTQLWTINLTQPLPPITNPVDIDGLSEAHVGEYYSYPSNFSSETDSLSIDPSVTGGSYYITIAPYTDQLGTARGGTTLQSIPWDATAPYIEGQLANLVGTGNVTVSGPTSAQSSASYTITFDGDSTGLAITESVTGSTLVGTNPAATLAVETAGGVDSGMPTEILASPNSVAAIDGDNAENRVVINGGTINSTMYPDTVGFTLDTSYAMVRGLDITGFTTGVSIPQATDVGDDVQGNFIGDYIVHPVDTITGDALPAPDNEYIAGARDLGGGVVGYANLGAGVLVYGTNTTVGGASTQDDNVITDNTDQGVFIEPGAEGAQVLGNQIGILGPSTAGVYYKRPNKEQGVLVEASSNRIGAANAGNLISANLGDGIEIVGATATENVVAANYIGEAPGGGYIFGNGTPGNEGDGVDIQNAPNNIIGQSGAGNDIASNALAGISVTGVSAISTIIADNTIGLTSGASQLLGNDQEGIVITSAYTTIGPGNVVSGNNVGILVSGSAALNTNITGNLVGTDGTGEEDLGNAQQGIWIDGAPGATIQGNAAGSQVISGNNVGIEIEGSASNALITGNFIGTDKAGSLALPNAQQGIWIENSSDNTIGGTTTTSKNLISANYWGVQIDGMASTLNVLAGNLIGTDMTGLLPLGNETDGILISNTASSNTIGGTLASQGNTIAFNTDAGVYVLSGNANPILSNSIFSNGQIGILLSGTGNDAIVYPVLITAATSPTTDSTNVRGSYTYTLVPDLTFQLQFFSNVSADPSGNYEGQTLIGSTTVTTNNAGVASFAISLPTAVTSGSWITATATFLTIQTPPATLNNGDTSEFSGAVQAINPFLVTTVADSFSNPIPGMLRYAIEYSNRYPSESVSAPNVIQFQLPNSVLETIFLQAALPVITSPVTIDGFSQAGSQTNDSSQLSGVDGINDQQTDTAILTVQVDGSQINDPTMSAIGFIVAAPGSTIDGLSITGFKGAGLELEPGSNPATASLGDSIWGNDIGVDQFLPTSYNSVNSASNITANGIGMLIDSPNNVIGGILPPDRNIIQGNSSDGIVIFGTQGTGNAVETNFVLDNGGDGVLVLAANNQIGLASGSYLSGAGNLISGNTLSGIHVLGPSARGNSIENNQIGTQVGLAGQLTPILGTKARANGASGITIENAPANVVGGQIPNSGNVLGGNALAGVTIENYVNGQVPSLLAAADIVVNPPLGLESATSNIVQGNQIGFNIFAIQVYPVPNQQDGIAISSSGNQVGGSSSSAQNIIIDNARNGIAITASTLNSSNTPIGAIPNAQPTANLVQGNYIGTQAGTNHFGNALDGILLVSAIANTIGGTASGAQNVISGNAGDGIQAVTSTSNLIAGNEIGTTADGSTALGNSDDGIALVNSPSNTIGGTVSAAANLIAANANGIHLSGAATSYNMIQGNSIGTNPSTTNLLGNALNGVLIDTSASLNMIGGSTAGTPNTIADNAATGVNVISGTGNSILSNSIVANGQLGIVLSGSGNNAIPAPTITAATPLIASTTIAGTFSDASLPSTSVLIQVFSNQQADPSGYGQGQTLIGSTTLITNAAGTGSFGLLLAAGVAPSLAISATATNIVTGDTSAFSADVVNAPQVAFSSSIYYGGEPLASYTVTVVRNSTYGSSTVSYTATPGSATPNVDFTPVSGTLAFTPGQSAATFSVPINSAPAGSGNFTIQLGLSNPTSAILGTPSTAILDISSIPGSLAFSSSSYQVAAGSGETPITVVRSVGAAGTVTVDYTAVYSQSFAAVPSRVVSGTLVFDPGVNQQSFSLPIPATGSSPYNSSVTISLSSATGGAILTAPASATVTITQPLTVTAEQLTALAGAITAIQISFSAPLDSTEAQNLSNFGYYAIQSGATGTFIAAGANATRLAAASYNPATQSVTIIPSSPLRLNTFFRVTIDGLTNGILTNGVSDTYGNLLAGNGTDPGTPFVVTFGLGNHLTYTDGTGNIVNLQLKHGGLIEIFRGPSGTAQQIELIGTTSKSTLTGSVRRVARSSGRTSLPTISAPSGAKLRLPRPSFILSNPAIITGADALETSTVRVKTLAGTDRAKAAAVDFAIASISRSSRSRALPRVKRPGDLQQLSSNRPLEPS